MPSKRSSSSRRPVEFPPVQHGLVSTSPPSARPLSSPRGSRRASHPRDPRKTVDLHRGFDPNIVNASATDTASSSQPIRRRQVSTQPPSAPLRSRSVSQKWRRDHTSNVEWRGRFDPYVEISLEAIMAPPYQPAQSEDEPQTTPPGSTPHRHLRRTSKCDQRTTIEDVHEEYLAIMRDEIIADGFKVPSLPRVGGGESPGFAQPKTPQKPVKEQPVVTPYNFRAASQAGARLPQDADNRYARYAKEAQNFIMGPMPVEDFLKFLPEAGPPPRCDGAFDAVNTSAREPEMYPQLIKAIEDGRFCPTIKFVDTSTVGEGRGNVELKPDVSGFAIPEMPQIRRIDNDRAKQQGERYEANLSRTEVFFEGKGKIDPFCDERGKNFLAWLNASSRHLEKNALVTTTTNKKQQNACGQVICYAVEQCARQHRTFLFAAMIIGSCARLFRFDRAGIIVTESFDYKKEPRHLCEFLWRFSHATAIQRGYDSTVTVASKTEEGIFKDNIAREVVFQLGLSSSDDERLAEAVKRHYEPGKVTKVKVFDDKGDNSDYIYCLISVPVASPRSVTGRCTRGYWAVISTGPKRGKVVFLKDVWRIDVSTATIESEVYNEMMEAEVENTSNKLYSGDVLDEESEDTTIGFGSVQITLSQKYVRAKWLNRFLELDSLKEEGDLHLRVFRHTHHRMILEDVGCPLSEFTGSRELFEAAGDVVIALLSAYVKCNRLHRDVSIGNIILVRYRGQPDRRKGVLIDWEFSVKADRSGASSEYTRSGTWAFMSFAILMSPSGRAHELTDDLESVLYVIMYASVQFLKHDFGRGLGYWMYKFFDDTGMKDGKHVGGEWKFLYALNKPDFGNIVDKLRFSNPHIHEFFSRMYADLRTKALDAVGPDLTWAAHNVAAHLDEVCDGLASTPGTDHDRTTNDTSDYYADILPPPKATHTSSRLDSDAMQSATAHSHIDNTHRRGSKRSLRHETDGPVAANDDDMDSSARRKRIRNISGTSVPVASGSLATPPPPTPPTTSLEEARTLSRTSYVRVSRSSTSTRMSRHASKSSQTRLLRKDSDLSSKSGKSSSRRARKPRSDTSRRSG